MKTAYGIGALVLAANDVSAAYVAWMIVGLVLLAAAVVLLVRQVRRMVRFKTVGALWPVAVVAVLVGVWLVGAWSAGWV